MAGNSTNRVLFWYNKIDKVRSHVWECIKNARIFRILNKRRSQHMYLIKITNTFEIGLHIGVDLISTDLLLYMSWISAGLCPKLSTLPLIVIVPDHNGGRPIEVNACILITHMVYL